MSYIEINKISNADLRVLAREAEKSRVLEYGSRLDEKLDPKDFNVFISNIENLYAEGKIKEEDIKQILDLADEDFLKEYEQIRQKEDLKNKQNDEWKKYLLYEENSWFKNWLNDNDKYCTDGKNDGSISAKECLANFGKGMINIVKTSINHPVMTITTVVLGGAAVALSGGALAVPLVTLGLGMGAVEIGYGAYSAATAKTDTEAKQAWEHMGIGTFSLVTSILGSKGALKAAEKAGVQSAAGASKMNLAQTTLQCIKSTPEAIQVGSKNIVTKLGSILNIVPKTTASGNIQPLEKNPNIAYHEKSAPSFCVEYVYDEKGNLSYKVHLTGYGIEKTYTTTIDPTRDIHNGNMWEILENAAKEMGTFDKYKDTDLPMRASSIVEETGHFRTNRMSSEMYPSFEVAYKYDNKGNVFAYDVGISGYGVRYNYRTTEAPNIHDFDGIIEQIAKEMGVIDKHGRDVSYLIGETNRQGYSPLAPTFYEKTCPEYPPFAITENSSGVKQIYFPGLNAGTTVETVENVSIYDLIQMYSKLN